MTYRIYYENDYAEMYEDEDGLGFDYEEAMFLVKQYNEKQEEKNEQLRSNSRTD